jgi:F-type H+-transporting ATPase subunit b
LLFPQTDIMVAPPPVDAYGETVATTEAESGGLPQFDTSVWGGQIAYLLFLFFVLYLLIAKVFAPRLRRVMDERATTITAAIATAKSVQAEAAEQAAAAKAEVAEARAQSRAMTAAAKARVTEEANARRASEEAEVNARIESAEAGIGRTRDAAMANVGTIAADTVQAMVERLTGQPVSAAEAAAAVKGAA